MGFLGTRVLIQPSPFRLGIQTLVPRKTHLALQAMLYAYKDIPPEELDKLLENCMMYIRPPKKDEYKPDSLISKYNSIVREKEYEVNINQDAKFRHSHEILSQKKNLEIHGFIWTPQE